MESNTLPVGNNTLDKVTQIARVCHEANREYCRTLGDTSQPPWDLAPGWQQSSARNGVENIADNIVREPADSHLSWCKEKLAGGWRYGPEKNPETKEHPCLVPYDQLPPEQRMKDHIFFVIARAMLGPA